MVNHALNCTGGETIATDKEDTALSSLVLQIVCIPKKKSASANAPTPVQGTNNKGTMNNSKKELRKHCVSFDKNKKETAPTWVSKPSS
jgi:hypothetical protein